MRALIAFLVTFCAACGVAPQPESSRTVAAFEVPLPTDADKAEFLALLTEVADEHGFHVDSSTPEELRVRSKLSPRTFSAAVWRGDDDEESIASAMDFETHLGKVWIAFPLGEQPQRNEKFRNELMAQVEKRWSATASLPIMPSGATPLDRDLVRTPSGYVVKPSEAHKYQKSPT